MTNILITGCSSGIGLETALFLKKQNVKSWIVSNNEGNLDTLLENITDIDKENNVKTKNNFFEEILGGINSENYKIYTKILESEDDNEIEKLVNQIKTISKDLPKFILYDEAGHLSYFERDIIEKLGIKLIAMGDLTQNSYINKQGVIKDIDYKKQLLKIKLFLSI